MRSFLSDNFFSPRPGFLSLALAIAALPCFSVSGETATDQMLKVITRDEGGQTHFYLKNLEIGSVTATLDARLLNLTPSASLPHTFVVGGKQTIEIFTLSPTRPGAAWNYSYTYACNLGNVAAVHDDKQIYGLPFAPGAAFRVAQGHHGKFSHTGQDEYAIDWKMPEGTAVCAARDGVVIKSKDDSTQGGPNRKYENLANCILVQHADGTIGSYVHLTTGGNKVKVGDSVKVGEVIGLSGNTGFTSGPHLHFAVYKLKSGSERMTIPVKFRTVDGDAVIPLVGQTYMAIPKPATLVATAELPAK